MAKLEISLSKEKFDALDESLKSYYVATQEGGYELDGVGSIQRALEAEKAAKKKAVEDAVEKAKVEALKPYEGLDVEAAKAAIEAAEKAAEDKHKKAGDFESLKVQLEERHQKALEKKDEEIKVVKDENSAILSTLKREKLANTLTEKGVLPDRVKYLVGELDTEIELARDDNGFSLKKIGGIGDATEFDLIIDTVKEKSPFFFASSSASGSGASGSSTNGNSGVREIPRAEYDANPVAFAKQLAKGEVTLADK